MIKNQPAIPASYANYYQYCHIGMIKPLMPLLRHCDASKVKREATPLRLEQSEAGSKPVAKEERPAVIASAAKQQSPLKGMDSACVMYQSANLSGEQKTSGLQKENTFVKAVSL